MTGTRSRDPATAVGVGQRPDLQEERAIGDPVGGETGHVHRLGSRSPPAAERVRLSLGVPVWSRAKTGSTMPLRGRVSLRPDVRAAPRR